MKKKNGKTANTGGVKKDDEDQSKRFTETAEKIGVDKSGKKFSAAVKRIKTSEK